MPFIRWYGLPPLLSTHLSAEYTYYTHCCGLWLFFVWCVRQEKNQNGNQSRFKSKCCRTASMQEKKRWIIRDKWATSDAGGCLFFLRQCFFYFQSCPIDRKNQQEKNVVAFKRNVILFIRFIRFHPLDLIIQQCAAAAGLLVNIFCITSQRERKEGRIA